MSTREDKNWPRASSWLSGESFEETLGEVAVVGAPLNVSISPGRCDLAPQAARKAMHRLSCFDLESDCDVRALRCHDKGDLPIGDMAPERAFEIVRDAVALESVRNVPVVVLGGDNGVTRPALHGLQAPLDRVGLVTLDAHLDLRDTKDGLHNGNPVRALLEDGLPGRNIVQIGIAPFANSAAYASVAREAGIRVVSLSEARSMGVPHAVSAALDYLASRTDAIYFDLDVDVLDRAFAPACPGSRPGGLAPMEAIEAARTAGRHGHVKAMDLVEIDPERDINDATCLAAGTMLLAFCCGVVQRLQS